MKNVLKHRNGAFLAFLSVSLIKFINQSKSMHKIGKYLFMSYKKLIKVSLSTGVV